MFKTLHLLLLIVFQVCSIPIGRFNRCVPGAHLESRQPQYAHVCDKLEVIVAVGLNQIVPCSQLMAVRGDSPVSFTLHCPLKEDSWCSVLWHLDTWKHPAPAHSASAWGKAGVCFGSLHWNEQQPTGENQDMLVGDSAGKAMTERCRNPREGLCGGSAGAAFSLLLHKTM